MTPQEINEVVSKKLYPEMGKHQWSGGKYPPFSTDIEAAWEIVDHLKSKSIWIDITWEGEHWCCNLYDTHKTETGDFLVWDVDAATPAMAICLAFLKLP